MLTIGLCGDGFADIRRVLGVALPHANLVEVQTEGRASSLPQVDVLVPLGARISAEIMDTTRPRLIQQFGVGLQGVDLSAAKQRGIPVANVPAADTGNADAVAEIAIFHVLALLRDYKSSQRSVIEGKVGQPCGASLVGKTVTLLGLGAIGAALLARLDPFGVRTLAIGRRKYADLPTLSTTLTPERYFRIDAMNEALQQTDVLIVCCPLTETTWGLISTDQLAAMPPGSYLINVGRGHVVDYNALKHAL
ncbi:lactate dehydrogenase-like 2-hydroxyacid dehydrogenase [Rhodococcus sp. 27YEA15]|uniref:NAD(P)-dependent oxidoreductase n=1 Tax=Rhodococcus sp. 27YEA15 TaxID=3156259 RepID=UPI003C7C4273